MVSTSCVYLQTQEKDRGAVIPKWNAFANCATDDQEWLPGWLVEKEKHQSPVISFFSLNLDEVILKTSSSSLLWKDHSVMLSTLHTYLLYYLQELSQVSSAPFDEWGNRNSCRLGKIQHQVVNLQNPWVCQTSQCLTRDSILSFFLPFFLSSAFLLFLSLFRDGNRIKRGQGRKQKVSIADYLTSFYCFSK